MKEIWTEIKAELKEHVPDHSFKMWIEPLVFENVENNMMVISAPNFFSRKRVMDYYADLIEGALKDAGGGIKRLKVVLSGRKEKAAKNGFEVDQQLALPILNFQPQNGRKLRKDFTFDNFVVGMSNDFAYSAALSFASRREPSQASLYLLSGTGMGKSHLSQAVGHHILAQSKGERVYYITAEDFTNDMVRAFRQNSLDKFKQKYRDGCDVLLLEDIHFLTGKERTQSELALTIDYLQDCKKRIIFSSCFRPNEIPKLSDQLRSRISCGLISPIDPPDFRTRVRILIKKAKEKGYDLPTDVIEYLSNELTDDIRQLESGLFGVMAKSSLLGAKVDISLAESVVKSIVQKQKKITVETIKKMVCKEFNVNEKDLVSRSRKQTFVRPRQVAMYLARRYTDAPLQVIGKSFNRYHATALHSISTVEKEIKKNGAFQKQVEILGRKIELGNF
ncbi:MAG: chromosomal replication initiator protein DnaA [Desulfobacterales bacterium]